jgi:hypothetical protein
VDSDLEVDNKIDKKAKIEMKLHVHMDGMNGEAEVETDKELERKTDKDTGVEAHTGKLQ